jgi:hypothetical protein
MVSRPFGLPESVGTEVYGFEKAAQAAAEAIRTNDTMPPDERQAMLSEIRRETERAIVEQLGEDAFGEYQRHGARWLNDLEAASLEQ